MNISAITPVSNGTASGNNGNVNSTPAFTGAIGDKFVREMMNGNNVSSKQILEAVKGTFGLKTEKVEDVLEALLNRISTLSAETKYRAQQLQDNTVAARKEIETVKREAQDEINQVREWNRTTLRAKDKELAAKDEEVKAAKEFAAKYEPMAKVKSINEIGTIMPDEALKLLDEISQKKVKSLDSMVEYLMTGKGQEEALAQINRCAVMEKAYYDGITQIPEVAEKLNALNQNEGLYPGSRWSFTMGMIRRGLQWDSRGSYLASPAIREQVKANAMGILTPMCNNRYHNTSVKATADELDEIFNEAADVQKKLSLGKKKFKNRYPDKEVTEEIVPYDFSKSHISVKVLHNGVECVEDYNYNQLYNWGSSNWD